MQTGLYKEMITVSQKIISDVNEKKNIIKLLAYFDMFDHPVSSDEIQFFLSCTTISQNELENILCQLQDDRHVFRHGAFYSLRNDPLLLAKRLKGHTLALTMLAAAHKGVRFFSRFPFVRGIAISGSLSKNVAEEDSDIDLFIITKANRLWIARTFMCLFIKIFSRRRRKDWFCLNYFVDEAALQIEEKNVFTAMEIITLMPVYGNIMNDFYRANTWVSNYYQGYDKKAGVHQMTASDHWSKKLMEFFFNNKFGNWLDTYLMRITMRRWGRSEEKKKLNSKGNQFGMKAGKHFSKPNPVYFQEKLLFRYNEKMNDLKLQMPELF